MKTKLKLSTLVRLAHEIEREHRCSIHATMNEMRAHLALVAGHCSTKAEAKLLIAMNIYHLDLSAQYNAKPNNHKTMKPLNYSAVVAQNLILPKKKKYTVHDCRELVLNSLFIGPTTFTEAQARFIVICSAIFHDTNYSKGVQTFRNNRRF